jgi:hypothetical protein
VASAEPGIVPQSTRTSVHDLDILFNPILKSQVTRCTCNEDTKTSMDLRDISPLDLPELQVRPHHAECVACEIRLALTSTFHSATIC